MNIVIPFLFVLYVLHATVNGSVAWQQLLPSIAVSPTMMMVSDGKGTLIMLQSDMYIYNSAAGSNAWDRSNYNYSALVGRYFIGAFYFEGQFLVYTTKGMVLTSPDGKVFTEFTLEHPLGFDVYMLVNNGTTIFASPSSTTAFSSSDGFHWNSQPFSNFTVEGPIFGTQSVLFVRAYNSEFYMTTDGCNYILLQISAVFGSEYTSASFYDGAPGEIIAFASTATVTTSKSIFSSHDKGISWSFVSSWNYGWTPGWFGYINSTHINQTYLAYESWLITSSDLTTWRNTSELLSSPTLQVVDDDLYVMLELGYSYTSDLNIWYNYSILVELFDHIYVLSDESFVLEGDESYTGYNTDFELKFFSTQDGTRLSQLPPPPFKVYSQQWEQDNAFYFLLGNSDILEIWATTDFLNWTLTTTEEPCQFTTYFIYADNQQLGTCLVSNEQNYTAVALYQSSKPNQWNLLSTSDYWEYDIHIYDLAYGNKIFVYLIDGTVQTSTDGVKWAMQTNLSTTDTQLFALNNLFFLVQTLPNHFFVAKDGKSWTPLIYPVVIMNSLSYSSAVDLYFAYGFYGEIATSTDGVSWSQDGYNLPTFEPSLYIEYNGETWLAVDEFGGLYTGH